MKKSLLIIALAVFSLFQVTSVNAQEVNQVEKKVYEKTFYFSLGQGEKIEKSELAKSQELLEWALANEDAQILITGWACEMGGKQRNTLISVERASTIRNFLIKNGVSGDRIVFIGKGVDRSVGQDLAKARRADVVATVIIEEPIEVAETPAEEPAYVPAVATGTTALVAATTEEFRRSEWALRTNLLYWFAGLMNLGIEWNPSNHWGIIVNGGYSPFENEDWEHQLGGWFVSPEVRYYFSEKANTWFLGAQFLAGGVNLDIADWYGCEGSVLCGGLTGGYRFKLSDTFDMDFSLGLGYSKFKYDITKYENGVRTLITEDHEKSAFLPIQAGVNLIWKFGK